MSTTMLESPLLTEGIWSQWTELGLSDGDMVKVNGDLVKIKLTTAKPPTSGLIYHVNPAGDSSAISMAESTLTVYLDPDWQPSGPGDAAAFLEAAADLIEESGWVQGDYIRDGKYCAIGALHQVTASRTKTNYAAGRLQAWLANHGLMHQSWQGIPDWNDQDGQTATSVVSAMRAAAAELRATAQAGAPQLCGAAA